MFANGFTGWHGLLLLAIVLLLFGAPRLPALARSIGQSMKIFRSEIKTGDKDATGTDAGQAPTQNSAQNPAQNGGYPNTTAASTEVPLPPRYDATNPSDTNPKP
ncbi:twin-arginine translocase TatA/TatE family subunit [Glaciihabitans sp. dw_435]|uniref:twin-arginine translocase TatA/TatE family subunit n=1 Tax=Glaciihabitans sp. dw_435 TaxID=2720081 RepID=UPI001BD1DD6A|nr:twin-arginine translocase TatA/TatE family subunit [Glaciihabitans sp. dw_435]